MRLLTEDRPWLRAAAGPPSATGAADGVVITTKEQAMAEGKKAPDDGVYTWNGRQYRARAGETMPPGAEFRALREGDMTEAEKAKAEARRERSGETADAKGGKAKAKTAGKGPSETTEG